MTTNTEQQRFPISKLFTLIKKESEGYTVNYYNGVFAGDMEKGDDGYFHWWPVLRAGYVTAVDLEELARILNELNDNWNKQVLEYLVKEEH